MLDLSPLCSLFVVYARHPSVRELVQVSTDASSLEQLLETMWESGRAAHPGLAVPIPLYIQHLAERCGEAGDLAALLRDLRDLHAADLFLTCACSYGLANAALRFDKAVIGRVPAFVGHMKLQESFVDDLKQELRKKLLIAEGEKLPGIAAYAGRGELGNWVRVAAVRAAISLRRGRDEQAERDDGTRAERVLDIAADPALEVMKHRYGGAFKQILQEVIAGLTSEQRNLLRLYYVDGMTTGEIATLFRLNQSNASRRLISIRETILFETRRRLREHLKLSQSAFEELTQMVQSQLGLSLSRILK